MKKVILLLLLLPIVFTSKAAVTSPVTIDLWPNGAPTQSVDPADTARVYVYLPPRDIATGRAVVICPGGGYAMLAVDHEGNGWAPFFNEMGIAAIVLKYRLPHGVTRVPIEDAEEAIRLVRRNARQWGIDPGQVGIMGSSAGGHLASTIATHATGDAAPDLQILFYPVITMDAGLTHRGSRQNLLGKDPDPSMVAEYSNELHVADQTPPAFIVLTNDDATVPPLNSIHYYEQLCEHHIDASLHVYPSGGHGFGVRLSFPYHLELLLDLKAWLAALE